MCENLINEYSFNIKKRNPEPSLKNGADSEKPYE